MPTWQKVTIGFAAIQTAALTNTLPLITLPTLGIVHAAFANVTTLFSGGAIATITVNVGPAGSLAKYMAASSIATAVLVAGVAPLTPGPESNSTTTAIQAVFISTVANLSALTQGSIDIYLLVSQPG